jgi:pimeloyl-ACP methyl ester carboxylesterase
MAQAHRGRRLVNVSSFARLAPMSALVTTSGRDALLTALAAGIFFASPGASAAAADYADPDTPGPDLSVSSDRLDASLSCPQGLARARVLLLSGTTVTPEENFSWNVQPALSKGGIPWCSVTTPEHNMGDMQLAAEYVVAAIRRLHGAGVSKVALVGHDQGGMTARWALRFWPDVRAMVSQVISIAAFHHGTVGLRPLCPSGCPPANLQMLDGSKYVKALNSAVETFPDIAYTQVYTRTDEIGQPNLDDTGTSSLRGGLGAIANIATQEICPLNAAEHLGVGTFDPVGWAIVSDALVHGRVARPERIDRSVCGSLFMPGVDPTTFATDALTTARLIATRVATYPRVQREPALARYVTAKRGARAMARRCLSRRVVALSVPKRLRRHLLAGSAAIGGSVVAVFSRRRLRARISLRGRPAGTVTVRVTYRLRGRRAVKQVRRFRLCA